MDNYVANVIPHLQQWWPVLVRLAYLVGIGFAVILINDVKSSGKKHDKLGSIGMKFRPAYNFIAESETKKEGICPSFFVVLNAL